MVVLSDIIEASSSFSSYIDHLYYDVFLSFRGEDTRLNFTDHLYKALIDAKIHTFMDDSNIQAGKALKPELETAIKASRASIIVLSKNYASSTWCLDELVLILDLCRASSHIVIPIFYHVDPTDVRNQKNSYGDSMKKHKQRMVAYRNAEERGEWANKIERWTYALREVASLKGHDVNGRRESKLIEEIVADINHRISVPVQSTMPLLFGMESSIQFVTSWLKDGSSHNLDILTIVGMPGIGKTSLARYIYELHHHIFDSSSFLNDISRRCDQYNGLLDLQKQLCGDISEASVKQVQDIFFYTSNIENVVAHKKVFLVLDDISNCEQLNMLLENTRFHPGSKIIITTNNAPVTEWSELLYNPHVQSNHTKHPLKGLNETASLQLLSFHAFKGKGPKEGYEEVSKMLVKYCEGLPFALEILGKFLSNRDVGQWEDYIEGLKKAPNSNIKLVLQLKFDSLDLDDDDKEVFKHIACFFVGLDRGFAYTVLQGCQLYPVKGIKNLSDKCFLTIGSRNELIMHHLVQEMGRHLVCEESPDKPWNRSILWSHEESFNVLVQNRGTKRTLGLKLDMRMLEKKKLCGSYELETDAFSKMGKLKVLQLNYVKLNGSYKNFPKRLRWLCMHGFPLKSIPSELPMEYLVALDMSYSNVESFDISNSSPQQPGKRRKLLNGFCSKETRFLSSLKILNLSFSSQLHRVCGFFKLPALERLILTSCKSLTEICESIGQCKQLVSIDLGHCNKLKKLPWGMVKLKRLRALSLDGCNLSELLTEKRNMDLLMMQTGEIESQISITAIVGALLRGLKSAISLPSSLVIAFLRSNNLSNKSFSMDLSSLSILKELYLHGNRLVELPDCVRSLCSLELLSFGECDRLKTVKHPPRTLRKLKFSTWHSLQNMVFDPNMSPLTISLSIYSLPHSSIKIEGLVEIQPIAYVKEQVLRSLGWNGVEFIGNQKVETWHDFRRKEKSQVQLFYEFGVFSTFYGGKGIPKWITHRYKGSLISFTIPLSPNNLRGLNICYVQTHQDPHSGVKLLPIIIRNITKNRTWIYKHYIHRVRVNEECVIWSSYWMFGENEMKESDQVTIDIAKEHVSDSTSIRECGMSFVYDDGVIGEDPLSYYKSWNHIICGDLSAFQLTTGEYFLQNPRFFWRHRGYEVFSPFITLGAFYKELSPNGSAENLVSHSEEIEEEKESEPFNGYTEMETYVNSTWG